MPKKILEWRQLAKLKSTYTDSLQQHADRETDRVHTSFSLAANHHRPALLLGAEPAEHPDPHRGRAGAIRRAFVAPEGRKLISADYSQIELRILAHIADIPQLRQAFEDGVDNSRGHRQRHVRRAVEGHDLGPAPAR